MKSPNTPNGVIIDEKTFDSFADLYKQVPETLKPVRFDDLHFKALAKNLFFNEADLEIITLKKRKSGETRLKFKQPFLKIFEAVIREVTIFNVKSNSH